LILGQLPEEADPRRSNFKASDKEVHLDNLFDILLFQQATPSAVKELRDKLVAVPSTRKSEADPVFELFDLRNATQTEYQSEGSFKRAIGYRFNREEQRQCLTHRQVRAYGASREQPIEVRYHRGKRIPATFHCKPQCLPVSDPSFPIDLK
jgi:hypothetical protein